MLGVALAGGKALLAQEEYAGGRVVAFYDLHIASLRAQQGGIGVGAAFKHLHGVGAGVVVAVFHADVELVAAALLCSEVQQGFAVAIGVGGDGFAVGAEGEVEVFAGLVAAAEYVVVFAGSELNVHAAALAVGELAANQGQFADVFIDTLLFFSDDFL